MSQKITIPFNGDEIARTLQLKYNKVLQSFVQEKQQLVLTADGDINEDMDVVKLLKYYYAGTSQNGFIN